MKHFAAPLAISALAYFSLAAVASAAGANDRTYYPTINPGSVAPGVTQSYVVRVTNYSQGLCQTCTPLHFIQHIEITVPAGFTLVTPSGAAGPVSIEPNWHVASIVAGSQGTHVITVITNSTTDATLVVGKSVNITVNAKYTGTISGGCTATVSPEWTMYVNQATTGGVGNAYSLAPGTSYPNVSVASSDCQTQTNLGLVLVTSNQNQSIRTTDTSASVTLTSTLTRSDTNAPLAGEPITFSLGAALPACTGVLTNGAGVATCTFSPQRAPYPIGTAALGAGTYDFVASFAGDTAPSPDLGGSTSDAKQLTVNADGTGLAVSNASTVYGGTVDLSAHLTSQSGSGIVGRSIVFFLNGVQAGSPATTDGSGWAYVSGVSTAGIGAGTHDSYIKATFAGDATYGAIEALGNLQITQQTSAISLSQLLQVYTGYPLSPTVTTDPAGLSTSITGAPQTNVGAYGVTATITNPNYSGSINGSFIITKATVTAMITASNKVYDTSNTASITSCTLSGVAVPDLGNVGCSATGTFASVNVADGIVVTASSVTLTGGASGNYQVIVMPSTSANITKATSSVTVTGGTFVYDNAPHAATGSASTSAGTLTNPTAVTIVYSGSCSSAPTTVAEGTSCTATGTYLGDANHSGSSNTATLTITKASSSVTVTGGSFPYDTLPHAATGTASTTAGSLTVPAVVTITYSGSCTSAPITVAEGTGCTATGNYNGDDNHAASSNTATITVTKGTQVIKYTAFTAAASAPGGAVTFSSGSPAICSVTPEGAVVILAPGSCMIVANQAGDPNYQAAAQRSDQTVKQ